MHASQIKNNAKDIMLHTPLNEQQFIEQGFDFELSFLKDYIKKQIEEGSKKYDKKRSLLAPELNGMDLVPAGMPPTDLNFTPYSAPSRGFNRAAADLPQSNPLF
jgi:hypothetical protein